MQFYARLNPNLPAGGISLSVKISKVLLEEKGLFFPLFLFKFFLYCFHSRMEALRDIYFGCPECLFFCDSSVLPCAPLVPTGDPKQDEALDGRDAAFPSCAPEPGLALRGGMFRVFLIK